MTIHLNSALSNTQAVCGGGFQKTPKNAKKTQSAGLYICSKLGELHKSILVLYKSNSHSVMTHRVCMSAFFRLAWLLSSDSDVYFSKCPKKHQIKPLVRSENPENCEVYPENYENYEGFPIKI